MASKIGIAGRKSEISLGKRLGAKMRPNSGAVDGAKGDGVIDTTLWEAKSTVSDSMKLEHHWLGKIAREARDAGKEPILTLSFTDRRGQSKPNGHWVLMPLNHYEEMKERIDAGNTRVDE